MPQATVPSPAPPPDPGISILVCTRDRPDKLVSCLESIMAALRAADAQAEILIIENGSREDLALSASLIDALGQGRCRLIRLPAGGLSEARNVAISQAVGDLLVFVDDDCVVAKGYICDALRHVREMRRERVVHYFIGGRVTSGDSRDLPFTIKDEPQPQSFHTGIHPGGFVQGCNFILPRETAELIGWFDTRFGAGGRFRAGEDTDYLIRAHAADVVIRYVPDMVVSHWHGRRTFDEVDRLNRNYAYANGAILAKHMGRHPWLAKHLAWTLRSALLERIGGPRFDAQVGLSWSSVSAAQVQGALAFATDAIRPGRLAH